MVLLHILTNPAIILKCFISLIPCIAANTIDVHNNIDAWIIEQIAFIGNLRHTGIVGIFQAISIRTILVQQQNFDGG